jgi:hypothetical protein
LPTLTLEIAGLGLLAAFTSPASVVTVIALLSMSFGKRRAFAFMVGRLLAIGLIAVLMVVVLQGQDFRTRDSLPSRAASTIEVVLGCLLIAAAAVAYRRPRRAPRSQAQPKWLDRVDRSHWSLEVVVGVVMLSYTLTLTAAAETLKANVGVWDAMAVGGVFAATSMLTVATPVAIVIAAPDRSTRVLADAKAWVLAHSRPIALIALAGIGALLVGLGGSDLA